MINMRFSSPVSKDLFGRSGKVRGSESPLARKADNVELIRSISQAGWQSKPAKPPQLPMVPLTEAIVLEDLQPLPVESHGTINGLGIQMGNSVEVEATGGVTAREKEGTVVVTSTVHVQTECSTMSSTGVDIPGRTSSKKLRPRISVSIPPSRPLSFRRVRRGSSHHYEKETALSQSISPASNPSGRSLGSNPQFRLEVISPLSAEIPRPERPYIPTSKSVPEVRLTPDHDEKEPSSASSTGKIDDDASSCYSARSSMSSFHMEQVQERKASPVPSEPVEFTIMSPTDAGVFDDVSPFPKSPGLKRSNLTLSLLKNKPLPPEPMVEVAPLLIGGRPCSRTTSMNGSHVQSASELLQPVSPISPIPFSSRLSIYSPVDLDTIDEAFRRSNPSFFQPEKVKTPEQSPTFDEVADAIEIQLSTVTETPPVSWDEVCLPVPLRTSRDLEQKMPSRPPPPPPMSPTPTRNDIEVTKRRIPRKAFKHVSRQIKEAAFTSPAEAMSATPPLGKKTSSVCRKAEPVLEAVLESPESAHEAKLESVEMERDESKISSPASSSGDSEESIFTEISARETERSLSVDLHESAPKEERRDSPIQGEQAEESALQEEPKLDKEQPEELQLRRNPSQAPRPRSLDLLKAVDVPAIPSPIPSPEVQKTMDPSELDRIISANAAEKVILNIMNQLDTLADLFTCAHLNRGFYRIFKRNEMTLIKKTLFKMSPAAWELREICPPYEKGGEDSDAPFPEYTPTTYLQNYSGDMYAMVALKSLILQHCSSFLRPETLTALSGSDEVRSSRIDDAFWRVWTFCQIFGCGKNREDDIVGQMDWLKGGVLAYPQSTAPSMVFADDFGLNSVLFNPPTGFAKGNGKGLSTDELYDMTEIWTCLGVLLRGFHGMRDEARKYGILDRTGIKKGDVNAEDAMIGEQTPKPTRHSSH
jgi:hypothetical protein